MTREASVMMDLRDWSGVGFHTAASLSEKLNDSLIYKIMASLGLMIKVQCLYTSIFPQAHTSIKFQVVTWKLRLCILLSTFFFM